MRSLNEILHSLQRKYGYTDREINQLSENLDQFSELSYMAFEKQKRLSEKTHCDKQDI